MKNALTTLCQLVDQRKAEKWPNVPAHARVKSKYSDKSANELTTAIVDFLNYSGHFASRLQSTGTFRADVQKYVPSQQRSGLPDVLSVVNGQPLFIEVKVGKDTLSDTQQETIKLLLRAGAFVFVAQTFQEFFDWFTDFHHPVPSKQ